jgi:hypothetical protein
LAETWSGGLMSLLAFEFGIRGAACGLFLLTAGLIWRDRRRTLIGRLTAAVAFSAAAASINSAPGFQQAGFVWRAPLLVLAAGTPAMFWLWAKAVFDDDFILRRRHAAPWLVSAIGVMLAAYGGAAWSWTAPAGDIMLQVWALGLAVLAAAQSMTTWRDDLVMGRRRLRVAVLLGSVLFISIDALWSSGIGPLGSRRLRSTRSGPPGRARSPCSRPGACCRLRPSSPHRPWFRGARTTPDPLRSRSRHRKASRLRC